MIFRKKILLFFSVQLILLISLANTSCQVSQLMDVRENKEALGIIEHYDTIIPHLMEEQNIPALSIALVDRDGIIWSNCYGSFGEGSTLPNTSETLFSIQSVSKSFTSLAILMAVDEGLLDLDAPLSSYIPGFSIHSYYDEIPLDIITLRHLLSHTAGLSHEAPVGNNYTSENPDFEDHVKSIQLITLRYPVGQRYSYSNLGIDLAAYILQVVSGKPFYQYLQESVFDPLGMKNSSANPDVILGSQNRAAGYSNGREEKRVIIPMQGAGGVYASINDMAKFVQFHLKNGNLDGKELISASLLEEMYTIPFPAESQTSGYALGIDTYTKYNSLFLNHGGGGYGYLADMAWYKELGIGAVVLTNSVNHRLQGSLYHEILDKLIKSQFNQVTSAAASDEGEEYRMETGKLKNLAGDYVGRSGSMQVSIHKGSLAVNEGTSLIPLTFYAENEAVLSRDGYKDRYRFILDDQGYPDYMVKLNGGLTWDYNEGPSDPTGPDSTHWDQYIGNYRVLIGGRPLASASLEKKNGYLYLSYMNRRDRLEEVEEGVFRNCNGEILQFEDRIEFASVFELVKRNE